ncbi:DNA helicase UvrD [Candidatus Woesearchaeota archaeon]|nr:DNA helicase UvrD [Candidatus Woesearchaeota archaeon]
MKVISDLHIHGKYSRATSKELTIPNLEKYARMKGLNLLGTGDFTHPKWNTELKKDLVFDDGILKTATGFCFIPQTEISLIYTDSGKGRRIHHVILAPDLETADQITETFKKRGRVDYDGRPIFKIKSPELVEMMHSISDKIEIIPAHIWTPWFGMLGSMSGFDSLKECFQEKSSKIHAIETGLSSDPAMNWRIKELDNRSILSFSDLHSFWPWRIGRECTILDLKKLNYASVLNAIRNQEIKETIEFFPEEGKYHYDGHRNCNVVMSPKETEKHKGICPACKKPLTKGVAYRVEKLADREEGCKPKNAKPFKRLIPLSEIIAGRLGVGVATQKVWKVYHDLQKLGNEIEILLEIPKEKLLKAVDEKLADLIIRNREQKIKIQPGYDGLYGKPIFNNTAVKKEVKPKKQAGLNQYC